MQMRVLKRFLLLMPFAMLLCNSAEAASFIACNGLHQNNTPLGQQLPGEKRNANFLSNRSLDVFVPIAKYIKAGDASKLSLWLDKSLDMQYFGISNQCSRVQATHIIKNFFKEYPPRDFVIIHKSGQAPAKYAIGLLNCGDDKFRVTLYVKTEMGKTTIQQIIIERD